MDAEKELRQLIDHEMNEGAGYLAHSLLTRLKGDNAALEPTSFVLTETLVKSIEQLAAARPWTMDALLSVWGELHKSASYTKGTA